MKKTAIAAILTIILFLGIFILIPEREFKKYEFPGDLIVNNNTSHTGLDTIAKVILWKMYGIDSVQVDINDIGVIKTKGTFEINAFIEPVSFKKDYYQIFLSSRHKFSRDELTRVLAHELAHLTQYRDSGLYRLDRNNFLYQGETINMIKTSYPRRKFEIDARSKEDSVMVKLWKVLYE